MDSDDTVAPVSEPTPPVIEYDDEKIEVIIKEVVRIRPQDFSAFKHSFEAWINTWDK
jgi:hypothetical protein